MLFADDFVGISDSKESLQKLIDIVYSYVLWRFIDDIFAIWQHGQEQLVKILQEINSFHQTIKFTAETSRKRMSLLLDKIVILDGRTIQKNLYTKPTDIHQYLSPDSCHPRHCTTLIPYKQSPSLS